MLADSYDRSPSRGAFASDLQAPGLSVRRIVEFIIDQLPAWRDHGDRLPARAEPTLNSQLCMFLNSAARRIGLDSVQFCAETPDESCKGRNLDITAVPRGDALWVEGRCYSEFEVILPIECKRLPTPTEGGRDEREYVITGGGGTTGGIQRFKLGVHGAANPLALMIAYIQRGDPTHWMSVVNGWLAEAGSIDLAWQDERLVANFARPTVGVHGFHSVHKRSVASSPTVELQHVWIVLYEATPGLALPRQLSLKVPMPEPNAKPVRAPRRTVAGSRTGTRGGRRR